MQSQKNGKRSRPNITTYRRANCSQTTSQRLASPVASQRFSEASFSLIEGALGERSGGGGAADGGCGQQWEGAFAAQGPYDMNDVQGWRLGVKCGGWYGGGGGGWELIFIGVYTFREFTP